MFSRLEIIVRTNKQSNKHTDTLTNKQTPLKISTSLRYATPVVITTLQLSCWAICSWLVGEGWQGEMLGGGNVRMPVNADGASLWRRRTALQRRINLFASWSQYRYRRVSRRGNYGPAATGWMSRNYLRAERWNTTDWPLTTALQSLTQRRTIKRSTTIGQCYTRWVNWLEIK